MRITSLTIAGFKGIAQKATLPLAPITLFFGANSTGKSTVLHALLYLYEVIAKRNFDPQYSSIAGEQLYFGGFHNLVHGKNLNGTITLGATLDFRDGAVDVWDDYLSDSERWLLEKHLGFTPDSTTDLFSFEVDIKWDNLKKRVFISRFECSSKGRTYLKFEIRAGKPDSDITFYEALPDWRVEDAFQIENVFHTGQWEPIPIQASDALPDINKRLELAQVPFNWDDVVPENPLVGQLFAEAALSQASLAPLKLLAEKLKSLLHIGPLRVVPNRAFVLNRQSTRERWYNGTAGWEQFGFGSEILQYKVNRVFHGAENLDTGYYFSAAEYGEEPHKEKRVYLTEAGSELSLLPTEVGVGISQVFPFVVAACLDNSPIISCEQPELHVHPRWQLCLSDMMLRACNQDKARMFLVESHSEHLILRLLKRRRQTAESECEGGEILPDQELSCLKQDIQIIFCEQEAGRTRLMPIKTTDEGEFDAPWPNGFFNERRKELF